MKLKRIYGKQTETRLILGVNCSVNSMRQRFQIHYYPPTLATLPLTQYQSSIHSSHLVSLSLLDIHDRRTNNFNADTCSGSVPDFRRADVQTGRSNDSGGCGQRGLLRRSKGDAET